MRREPNKSKLTFPGKRLTSFTGALAIMSLPLLSFSQVVIEGGPAEIQISDEDGQPEAVNPLNNKIANVPPAPAPPVRDNAATIDPAGTDVSVRVPIEDGRMKVRNIIKDQPAVVVEGEITATQTVPPVTMVLSVAEQKQLSELKKELGIADSALSAKAVFQANEMFEEDTPILEETMRPTLDKLASYMELSPKDSAMVIYHYVPNEETDSEARLRALNLVEYLKKGASASTTAFTIAAPKPVAVETPKSSEGGQFITESEPLIEIILK